MSGLGVILMILIKLVLIVDLFWGNDSRLPDSMLPKSFTPCPEFHSFRDFPRIRVEQEVANRFSELRWSVFVADDRAENELTRTSDRFQTRADYASSSFVDQVNFESTGEEHFVAARKLGDRRL